MAKVSTPRQRVGLPSDVAARFKVRAAQSGGLLRDVHIAAVRRWLNTRSERLQAEQPVSYLRAPRNLKDQLVDLDGPTLDLVREVSSVDDVSVRAVLFTALVQEAPTAPPP